MMKPSDYNGIATGLNKLTEWADTLRAVFEKVEAPIPENEREPGGPTTRRVPTDEARNNAWFNQRWTLLTANENTAKGIAGMMDSCLDGFVVENQGRADNGRAVTTDGRALFDTMSRFLNATDTPIDGAARLYDDVRTRCRDWVGRMTTWFPDLNPDQGGNPQPADGDTPTPAMSDRDMRVELFRGGLLNKQEYKNAITNKHIKPPFTWLGSISDLADWLDSCDLIPKDPPRPKPGEDYKCLWRHADGAFTNTNGNPITARQLTGAMKELKRPK